jgi:uncharacterized protein YprB with RNaseH-like and TPR domain
MYKIEQVTERILFLDVETVCMTETYDELSDRMKHLWGKKSYKFQEGDKTALPEDLYFEKAAIQAEFGKIICISCGYLQLENNELQIKTKSFYGHDEYIILTDFAKMLDQFFSKKDRKVCTHNGREFDIPYIGRRMLVNRIPLPQVLDIQGKKSWQVDFIIDTQELWKFGDMKAFTSLDLLAAIFNIPSPKDDIDGSQVSTVYWKQGNLERIKTYCEKDVLTTAQVFLSMNGLPIVKQKEE